MKQLADYFYIGFEFDEDIVRDIVVDGFRTSYTITRNGDVINSKGDLRKTSIKRGYKGLRLNFNGIKRYCQVHRLVAEAFIPNPNNFDIVNHIDGDKLNNSVDNLEWTTQVGNVRHAFEHGLCPRGVKRNSNIFSEDDIHKICKLLSEGYSSSEIYDVMVSTNESITISQIYNVCAKILHKTSWDFISKLYPIKFKM